MFFFKHKERVQHVHKITVKRVAILKTPAAQYHKLSSKCFVVCLNKVTNKCDNDIDIYDMYFSAQ